MGRGKVVSGGRVGVSFNSCTSVLTWENINYQRSSFSLAEFALIIKKSKDNHNFINLEKYVA